MSLHVDIRKRLQAFTLEVALDAESETVGLLGESGCGKSMTLRCIAGIERPDEGRIEVNGMTYFDSAAGIDLKPRQRKTALLFQNYMLFPYMTVADNVAIGVDAALSVAERSAVVEQELARFRLHGLEDRYPLQLSGGQQQRVALARMLAARPGILMLDEPFSALDTHLKDRLARNMSSLFDAFKGTILYVSHDIDEAIRFCDRIAVVSLGQVQEVGAPEDIVEHAQSEAGLKLTGCKNIARVQRTGEREVYVPDWGMRLRTGREVPDDVHAVGLREADMRLAEDEGAANVFPLRVEEVYESRYDRYAVLALAGVRTQDGAPDNSDGSLIWRIAKSDAELSRRLEVGRTLQVQLSPESLHLVRR